MNTKTTKVLTWIDTQMKFDTWYNVKTEEQKQTIINLMDADFLPDCEFNSDYTKFRKSKLANDTLFKLHCCRHIRI